MRPTDHPKVQGVAAYRALRWVTAAVALLPLSCGSKGSVAVSTAIYDPDLAVDASSVLAARLTGGFRLHLELGQHASAGTDVAIGQGNFTLVDAASQASLVLLKFTVAPTAPHRLEPGGTLDIAFTMGERPETGQLLTKQEEGALCAARAAVQVAGSISDSSGPVPVNSTSFPISCP
jgi:hypothetical protein